MQPLRPYRILHRRRRRPFHPNMGPTPPEAGKTSSCSHPRIRRKFQVAISRSDWDPLALLRSLHHGSRFLRPVVGGISVQMRRLRDEGFRGGEVRRGGDELRQLRGVLARRGAAEAILN
ncbi:hypothetical protein KSP39_PZI017190 [Platanthera zijinensis]|uniref:Uncharacterized protein n=1 Tax=Platanthera zijinensis TaxID=2320716 RepID=A0AAP0FZT4_9ASPA